MYGEFLRRLLLRWDVAGVAMPVGHVLGDPVTLWFWLLRLGLRFRERSRVWMLPRYRWHTWYPIIDIFASWFRSSRIGRFKGWSTHRLGDGSWCWSWNWSRVRLRMRYLRFGLRFPLFGLFFYLQNLFLFHVSLAELHFGCSTIIFERQSTTIEQPTLQSER